MRVVDARRRFWRWRKPTIRTPTVGRENKDDKTDSNFFRCWAAGRGPATVDQALPLVPGWEELATRAAPAARHL